MTPPLLVADAVTFRVRERALIEQASLTLDDGQVAIVIGPNGAGKSTLLKVLAGEYRPAAGRVALRGELLHAMAPWRLACIRAVLPQNAQLFLPLRVHQVAALGLDGIGRALTPAARRVLLERALVTAGIVELAGRLFQTLSGGEQQRVHFARVLCQLAAGRASEPRQVLFLDEPTANLDLGHQLSLLGAARALAREGTGVLAIIHDLNIAAAFADRLIVVDAGRIVAQGPPVEVLTDRVMAEVFRVPLRVREVPEGATPFVLPRRSLV